MGKRCPPGFVCTDNSTLWLVIILVVGIAAVAVYLVPSLLSLGSKEQVQTKPHVIVIQQPQNQTYPDTQQQLRPDLYPEPVQRYGVPGIPSIASRGRVGPVQQVGILTGEGGSSSSAAPDRTILPLYGRELDPRRSRWNYYTRTDGANPVQVPVRVQNRVCDDDTNGCNEIYSDDSVHVPALGRSFKATVYRKTLF
jgi:hypothetical protein